MSPEERDAGLTALALVRTALENRGDAQELTWTAAHLLEDEDHEHVIAALVGMLSAWLWKLPEELRDTFMSQALDGLLAEEVT